MEKKKDDFFVGYIDDVSPTTKKTIKSFVWISLLVLITIAIVFAFTQNTFKNSSFELTTNTKIMGVYHEMPYPMLKVKTGEETFKNIVLLGFGKSSANPFLKKIRDEISELSGSMLSIEGNLIYYNGKTLLQITSDEKVTLLEKANSGRLPQTKSMVKGMELKGEIIDPKCYFGVMKPGKGKIHRSCAVLCISGGIPPVLATTDKNNISEYYLITDNNGKPINKDILPYVGKPSIIKGDIVQLEDWYQLRIDTKDIQDLNLPSKVY
ncbi:hypothetical protein [Aquimarina sp. 2201CG5-10]|uniref:hypothetical protein n=1 Tax=Aquimarina callyspongiae TaxID=3098150 RepID=UPI002AB4E6AE|nr:hypothetical protein [Aquimarina sp. 2201CG5-10]MDY8134553.1 hypothetical protein [Aquimarina sp. 2201CG5-10]